MPFDFVPMMGSYYKTVIVVAVAKNRVIGRGGVMPWHIPGELKEVKARTMARPLIMGRKTYQSIGKPLVGRMNIILTRDRGWRGANWDEGNCVVAGSPQHALAIAEDWIARQKWHNSETPEEIIIFGGGEVYKTFLPLTDEIEETEIDLEPEGDAWFQPFDVGQWQKTVIKSVATTAHQTGYTRALYVSRVPRYQLSQNVLSQAA